MPFRNAQTHLIDILDAIALIEQFLGTMTFDQYNEDLKTQSAVERQLQIVTEAAHRLKEDEALCPGPDWKSYRDMGNILRHGYHKVDNEVVWIPSKTTCRP